MPAPASGSPSPRSIAPPGGDSASANHTQKPALRLQATGSRLREERPERGCLLLETDADH